MCKKVRSERQRLYPSSRATPLLFVFFVLFISSSASFQGLALGLAVSFPFPKGIPSVSNFLEKGLMLLGCIDP